MVRFIGMSMLLIGASALAFAGPASVPEIDASAGASAIALLSGAILVLRSRSKKA